MVPETAFGRFGKILKGPKLSFIFCTSEEQEGANAVIIACFMKECLTASCFLIWKKVTKTVDDHGHPMPEPWCSIHKNMHNASYMGKETGRH